MSEEIPANHENLLASWRSQIKTADINNIFCHCRKCGGEWVSSSWDDHCPSCSSQNIQKISCWQFPDD